MESVEKQLEDAGFVYTDTTKGGMDIYSHNDVSVTLGNEYAWGRMIWIMFGNQDGDQVEFTYKFNKTDEEIIRNIKRAYSRMGMIFPKKITEEGVKKDGKD